jgi:hypothetical protein
MLIVGSGHRRRLRQGRVHHPEKRFGDTCRYAPTIKTQPLEGVLRACHTPAQDWSFKRGDTL